METTSGERNLPHRVEILPGPACRGARLANCQWLIAGFVTAVTAALPQANALQAAKNAACNQCYRIWAIFDFRERSGTKTPPTIPLKYPYNSRADGSNQSVRNPSAPNPNEANASDGRTE
jgi:hypothetical protein